MCCLEREKIIQTFTPLSRKSLIDSMEPERRVRLNKFNVLRSIRQAYLCTVTIIQIPILLDFCLHVYFYAYIIYNKSVKGSEFMNRLEQIGEISTAGNGVLRTSEVISKGISKTTLAKFVEKYNYERISHGIYCSPDVWKDGLYLLQLRCPKTIFSHDTALFLLDMTDQEPLQYTVTVKSGYNATHLREDGVKVFSIKKDFFELGISKAKTPFGNEVFIYNPERTVCDMIRSRSQIEIQIFQDAMKQYIRRKDNNLHLLMEYAKKLRVNHMLSKYLEVLL